MDRFLIVKAAERTLHARSRAHPERGQRVQYVPSVEPALPWDKITLHMQTSLWQPNKASLTSMCYLPSTHSKNVDYFTALASAASYCQEHDQDNILKINEICDSDVVCHLLYSRFLFFFKWMNKWKHLWAVGRIKITVIYFHQHWKKSVTAPELFMTWSWSRSWS